MGSKDCYTEFKESGGKDDSFDAYDLKPLASHLFLTRLPLQQAEHAHSEPPQGFYLKAGLFVLAASLNFLWLQLG